MYGTQSLCYTNPGPNGQREVVVEGDPRQAVLVYTAGNFISEAEAIRLGITEWMVAEAPSGPEARSASAAPDASANVTTVTAERTRQNRYNLEARAYVENAVGTGTQLSAAERGEAGRLGAEITGPTIPEIAEAGSPQAATEKAAAEMTGSQKPPEAKPAEQTSPSEPSTPPPSEPPSGETPPRRPVGRP
jgi:hypothetical protein